MFGGGLGFERSFQIIGDDSVVVLELADELVDAFVGDLAD